MYYYSLTQMGSVYTTLKFAKTKAQVQAAVDFQRIAERPLSMD